VEKIIHVTIDLRNSLRKARQYDLADALRDQMGKAGVKLVDKPEGTEYEIES